MNLINIHFIFAINNHQMTDKKTTSHYVVVGGKIQPEIKQMLKACTYLDITSKTIDNTTYDIVTKPVNNMIDYNAIEFNVRGTTIITALYKFIDSKYIIDRLPVKDKDGKILFDKDMLKHIRNTDLNKVSEIVKVPKVFFVDYNPIYFQTYIDIVDNPKQYIKFILDKTDLLMSIEPIWYNFRDLDRDYIRNLIKLPYEEQVYMV
jgi:hypothetical protein